MRNREIIYWKWDKTYLEEGVLEKELVLFNRRCPFDTVYLKYQYTGLAYNDPKLKELLLKATKSLSEYGKQILLDIDPRGENVNFLKKYPGKELYTMRFAEGELDENGYGEIAIESEHLGEIERSEEIKGAWLFEKTNVKCFRSNSLTKVECEKKGKMISIFAGKENAFKSFCMVLTRGLYKTDVLSAKVNEYYKEMFEYFSDIPVCGAGNDEWGNGIVLNVDAGHIYTRNFPVSNDFCMAFEKEYGYSFYDNAIFLAYEENTNKEKSHRMISDYIRLLRKIIVRTNNLFYEYTKTYFGADAFVGVHPTYWGDPYDFAFDALHNGFNWWEVKRDVAQTDEFVIMPIRLALSHKWNDSICYNMWYSAGTHQLHTYFQEAWQNLKFYGKVHYHSWKSLHERNVYHLYLSDGIEQVAKMEERIEEAFDCLHSVPDSSVLIVFGMESVTDWLDNYDGATIQRGKGTLKEMLQCVQSVFGAYNCDLVPSTEIENGSVYMENGKVCYGKQVYNCIVCLCPQRMSKIAIDFLNDYSKNNSLIVAGPGAKEFDGAYRIFDEINQGKLIIETLKELQIPTHRVGQGVEYRDGSIVFVSNNPMLPINNYFETQFVIKDKLYDFKGYDYLIINPNKGVTYFGEGSLLQCKKI